MFIFYIWLKVDTIKVPYGSLNRNDPNDTKWSGHKWTTNYYIYLAIVAYDLYVDDNYLSWYIQDSQCPHTSS